MALVADVESSDANNYGPIGRPIEESWEDYAPPVIGPLAPAINSVPGVQHLDGMELAKMAGLLVDYGLQLYTPWQLASGKLLGRDLAYLAGGPFSQYVHAALFTLFGTSFLVLVIFNLSLLLLFVVLMYRLFLFASDHWTAGAISLSLTLFVFSFSQYVAVGNYNYVCPYTYESFHGLVLSAAAIGCLSAWLRRGRHSSIFGAGLCLAAVFLTKPDSVCRPGCRCLLRLQ